MFTSHHNWKEKRHNTNFFIQLGLALIVHRLPACPNQWSLKTLIFLHCSPRTFMWMFSSWSRHRLRFELAEWMILSVFDLTFFFTAILVSFLAVFFFVNLTCLLFSFSFFFFFFLYYYFFNVFWGVKCI